ncbi:hypothetical protein AWH56_011705 [Anaerobacillus isosaccharinicus]|uniref:Uncharacterized protein n=1 Tax=Anaerobacillus isosaccharinicus TaxID=1532552 RepID=A0A1S2M892_9BACI|nr:hypothetical protein [Anaerobacillus isosaccharinicus]MBA5588437.1 hypothetical protein [Anaerobacillus isosaccharinicus]QOY38135.1 hypothetical protein AWH56_011705 [Anaerobacillus isosaccharinicus]
MKYKFAFFSVFVWALLILAGCLNNESEIQEVVKSPGQISIVMEGQGMVVNVKNTGTGYIVSKELTKTLLQYIN